jgi:hypothetical protein
MAIIPLSGDCQNKLDFLSHASGEIEVSNLQPHKNMIDK